MSEVQSKSIKGGYLNSRQARDGSWYLEGNLGSMVIRVYENKYKRTDQDPSHVWYLSPKSKPQTQGRQAQGGQGFQPRGPAVAPTQAPASAPPRNHAPQGDQAPPGQWDAEDEPLPF
jgi:hypothetical protein